MPLLNTILGGILDLIFPAKCILCGKNGADLCLNCLSEAPEAERESASWIFPLYDYRHGAIKKSLWLLKYKGKKRLANVFALSIYGKIIEELSELSIMENFTEPILIPIPLSKKRYMERGFNQAELICEELINISQQRKEENSKLILEKDVLIKPFDTEHQARIKNRQIRLKNLVGSFAIKDKQGALIKNRNIILIDDITTTGATLSEARKILKQAGARKVIAFTLAH